MFQIFIFFFIFWSYFSWDKNPQEQKKTLPRNLKKNFEAISRETKHASITYLLMYMSMFCEKTAPLEYTQVKCQKFS